MLAPEESSKWDSTEGRCRPLGHWSWRRMLEQGTGVIGPRGSRGEGRGGAWRWGWVLKRLLVLLNHYGRTTLNCCSASLSATQNCIESKTVQITQAVAGTTVALPTKHSTHNTALTMTLLFFFLQYSFVTLYYVVEILLLHWVPKYRVFVHIKHWNTRTMHFSSVIFWSCIKYYALFVYWFEF